MNVKRIFGLALVVCALAVALPVSAAAADNKADDLSVYFRPAVRFGTDDRTLFILDFLVPVYRGNKGLLFVNAKFTPDNHEAWETNAGIGYRHLVMDDKLVLGGNVFYDHRKTRYGSHFDQIGLGFEAMAEPGGIGLATRFNYYQPLTKAKLGESFGYAFYGNGIYTAGIEEPMTGFDYEAGIRIPGISNYVETWAYAGGYHFFGCHVPDVNGVSARLEAMPTDFLRLNFEFRNDSVNNDQYYGEVAFEVPFSIDNLVAGKNPFEGIGDVLTGSRSLKERMVEPVRRDVDIVVGTDYLTGPDAAGYGTYKEGIIFVSDNAPDGGDGSFEHPYNTLSDAANDPAGPGRLGDTIFTVHVLPGSGTIGLAGYNFDIEGVTIWGAGAANPAYPNVANFAPGWPLVYSTLTMDAQNMTVMGLYFDTNDESAIEIGFGAAGAPLWILSNRIDAYGYYGIHAYLSGGEGYYLGTEEEPIVIADNEITINWNSYEEQAGIGLFTQGNMYASILDNRITGVLHEGEGIPMPGSAYGIHTQTRWGDINGLIAGNEISDIYADGGEAAGIYADADYDFEASIAGNTIDTVWAYDAEFLNAYGIYAYAEGYFTGSIYSNRVSDIGTDDAFGTTAYGIYGEAGEEGGDFYGSIYSNHVSGVEAVNAYYAEAYGIAGYADSDFEGSIYSNVVSDVNAHNANYVEAYGIYGDVENRFYGSIDENLVSGIGAYDADYAAAWGIDLYSDNDIVGSIDGNTISDVSSTDIGSYAFVGGIHAYADDEFWSEGSISGNTISRIAGYGNEEYYDEADSIYVSGISAYADEGFDGSITGNTITDILADGDYAVYELSADGIFLGDFEEEDEGEFSVYGIENFGGMISGNTIDNVFARYFYDYAWAGGIEINTEYHFDGSISGNTITNIGANGAHDVYSMAEAAGIYSYLDYALFEEDGSISGNTIDNIWARDAYEVDAYGIISNSDDGDFYGSISGNTIGNIWTEYAYVARAYGIYSYADMYDAVDRVFGGSISDNTINTVSANDAYYVQAYGIYNQLYWGVFGGSISGNTIDTVLAGIAGDEEESWAYGIYNNVNLGSFGGSISANTLTGISSAWGAAGISLYASMTTATVSITDNSMEIAADVEAYGLVAEYGTLGTSSTPMIITGNNGHISALAAYAMWLEPDDPGNSNVWIGYGGRMGANSFDAAGGWDGNYPLPGGPIWANDNGSFITP